MTTRYRADALHNSLRTLHQNAPEIKLSVLANNDDGLVAAVYPPESHGALETEAIAATTASLVAIAERSLVRAEKGGLGRIVLDGTDGTLITYPCLPDVSLTVLVGQGGKVGIAMLAAERAANQIREILAPRTT